MVEPVTATAAAGAAAVAAPAAAGAAPAAAGTGAAGTAGGSAAGPGAASGLTPANALKMMGNGLDSVASLPTARADPGGFTSTRECHSGPRQQGPQDQQAPYAMPDLETWGNRAFLGPVDHGQGGNPLRQPASRENPLDPSPRERAMDDHGLRGPAAREATPERRADADKPGADKPDAQAPSGSSELAPSPEVRGNAPAAGRMPDPAEGTAEPRPEERAAAEKPQADEAPRKPAEADDAPTSDERARSDQPAFERKTEAALKGATGGFLGIFAKDLFDLSVSVLSKSDAWGPWLADMQPEEVSREFGEFGEAANYAATEQDETFGTLGAFGGSFGPEVISPSSKGKAVKQVGKTLLKAKATKMGVDAAKKKIDDAAAKAAAKKAARKAALAVEKSAPYRELERKGLVSTQPVKESGGSWFQRWLSKKDHEYVAVLKNGKTVQIDDFAVGADGKLVIIEAKFMKKTTEIAESGHTKFASDKVDHIKRLIQFANENKDTISHIEFTVSRTEAAAIYADIVVQSIKQNVIGPLITFGKP